MDERPKYKMRFVGFNEHGELKPTAPGTYKKNEIRELPLEYADNFWWELIDAVPDLVIPEERYEDSVFVEETFVPSEDKEKLILPVEVTPEDADVIHYDKMTVKSLRLFIKQRSGKVDPNWLKADLVREARELEESLRVASEASTEEPAEEDPLKTLVEKQNELAKRFHDGEITADQYRELSDKLNARAHV